VCVCVCVCGGGDEDAWENTNIQYNTKNMKIQDYSIIS